MRTDKRTDISDLLTAEQAAPLLGHSSRHVRRLIARGELEGTRDPYRTTRAAVDAYRFRQRRKGADVDRTRVQERSAPTEHRDELVDILVSHVERLARENGRLQAEVGRLEAELAQLRGRGAGDRRQDGHNGHGGRALSRLVPWLRR